MGKKRVLEFLRTQRRLIRFRLQMIYCFLFNAEVKYLPNVLCVGVPKAATTWLYDRLNLHSQAFLPKGKELHFFDEISSIKTSNKLFDHKKSKLFWGFKFDLKSKLHWAWYSFQFRRGGNAEVRMDITPTYCRISDKKISIIKDEIPMSKIILIIRNPIERAWSGAAYFMDRYYGKSLEQLNKKVLYDWVFDSERLDYGNYIDMVTAWDLYYREEVDIQYIFYDDIQSDPRIVLGNVCDFINIDKKLLPSAEQDKKKVNSKYKKMDIPELIKEELVNVYQPQIEFLQQRFNRDLSHWIS